MAVTEEYAPVAVALTAAKRCVNGGNANTITDTGDESEADLLCLRLGPPIGMLR